MSPLHPLAVTRRHFLSRLGQAIGSAALASLLNRDAFGAVADAAMPAFPNFAPKAKRVIYLFMSGGPSHLDLFDHKPKLREMHGKDLPPEVRGVQRLTGMSANQASFP